MDRSSAAAVVKDLNALSDLNYGPRWQPFSFFIDDNDNGGYEKVDWLEVPNGRLYRTEVLLDPTCTVTVTVVFAPDPIESIGVL